MGIFQQPTFSSRKNKFYSFIIIFFLFQMPDQYVFCHLAFIEYVLNMEHVEEIDLTGFDDDCDSD